MNIRSLQQLLGHASLESTMIYLHVSEVPLKGTFSPLDKLEQ
jgi:site-specific recombinase XerD